MALECQTKQLGPFPTVSSPWGLLQPSDVQLMGGQGVHERAHEIVGGEIEDEPKRDGDGESWQRLLEHGEQQEGQTQTLRDTKGQAGHDPQCRQGAADNSFI